MDDWIEPRLLPVTSDPLVGGGSSAASFQPHPPASAALDLDDDDIQDFVKANKACNTVKKTESDMKQWIRWCASVGEKRSILDIPSGDLDKLLKHFYVKVRSKDHKEYEPETITGFQRSLDRYLRDNGQTRSIIRDIEFHSSREALAAKRKALRKEGKGLRPNAANSSIRKRRRPFVGKWNLRRR